MLDLDDLAKLKTLHSGVVPESSHLEYKASPAIENTEKARAEISRDISAMANADGGQIVYGMTESKDHLPTGLDGGINPNPCGGLWLEQVIQQNVHPKIEGLKILPVPKGDGNHYFVVTVPRSMTVHQAKDGRYYRRHNFRIFTMEDFEIREAMNRNTAPELYVTTELPSQPFQLTYQPGAEHSDPVTLLLKIGNRSNTLALYSVLQLHVDQKLTVTSMGVFEGPYSNNVYVKKLSVPHHFPIFREMVLSLNDKSFNVAFPKLPPGQRASYEVFTVATTPGSSTTNQWRLLQLNHEVSIEQTH
jgi:hypothetical protein